LISVAELPTDHVGDYKFNGAAAVTSGSGQGAPVCVQRTIAREIKQLEK